MYKTLPLLLMIVSFFAFFRLGDHLIQDWDESRHGINAIEMLQNGDWVNLHFKGQPDDWNIKPPLAIWAIALSYTIFGTNELALRIPSALAIILAFFFLYKIIRLHQSEQFAFFTCLILVTVKGWIGYHVGRTGDTDAMLVTFLMGGTFFFLKFLGTTKEVNILFSALFFGLAFLTKGFAMMVFAPSILLFSFFTQKLQFLFSKKITYLALILFLLFPIGWLWIKTQYGISFPENSELKNNDFTSIIFYDLAERFSNPEFVDPNDLPSKLFFFSYLDTRFNLWNYFFYLGILGVLLSYLLKKTNIEQIFSKLKSPLILVSICWTTPLILFQSFANLQHHWYLAPALPFIAILTYEIVFLLKKQFPFFKYIFFGTLVFTLFRQINMFNSFDEKSKIIETNQTNLAEAKRVINLIPHPSQSLILELYHCNPNQFFENNISKFNFEIEKSDLIILRKEDQKLLPPTLFLEYIPISRENEFCILRKK